MAVLKIGVLGAAATVDAKLQQATAIDGSNTKGIAGKTITQLVKVDNDNDQVTIALK